VDSSVNFLLLKLHKNDSVFCIILFAIAFANSDKILIVH